MHWKQRDQNSQDIQNPVNVRTDHALIGQSSTLDDRGSLLAETVAVRGRYLPGFFYPPPRTPPPGEHDIQIALARGQAMIEYEQQESRAASAELFYESAATMLGKSHGLPYAADAQWDLQATADPEHFDDFRVQRIDSRSQLASQHRDHLDTRLQPNATDLSQQFGLHGLKTMEDKLRELKAWEERAERDAEMWRSQQIRNAKARAEQREREELQSQLFSDRFIALQISNKTPPTENRSRLRPRQATESEKEKHQELVRRNYSKRDPRLGNSIGTSVPALKHNHLEGESWIIDTHELSEPADEPKAKGKADQNFKHFQMAKRMGGQQVDFAQRAEERRRRAKERAKSAENRRLREKEEEMLKRMQERSTFKPCTNAKSKKILALAEIRKEKILEEDQARSCTTESKGGQNEYNGARPSSASARLRRYWEEELEMQANQEWAL